MSHSNDSTHFACTERLNYINNNELLNIHKLVLILSIIKEAPIKKFKLPETENLQKAIKILSIQNYLKLDHNLTLLGLDNCLTIELSYTERKAILNYINEEIINKCTPIVNYMKEVQKEWPNIFKKEERRNEILALEEKRHKLHIKLTELKNRKYSLLKSCAEIKIGPYLENELNLRYSNYKLNQVKANALKGLLVHEFCSSTDLTMNAIKQITKYIEDELD